MKYDSAWDTLKALTSPGDIATAYTFNGHGTVIRIRKHEDHFVLAFDDGGVAISGVAFKDRHDLETVLPIRADPLEVGFEHARYSLITKFIASCGEDSDIKVLHGTASCPLCDADWVRPDDEFRRVDIYDQELDRTVRIACGTCLTRFCRG